MAPAARPTAFIAMAQKTNAIMAPMNMPQSMSGFMSGRG